MTVSTLMRGLLVLNHDVLVVPVADLPDDTRSQIDHDSGDYALSRPQARTGSKIIDAEAAALVTRFAEPRSLTDAVILFARERQLDPMTVLEGAHTFVRGLVDAGFLVSSGDIPETPRGQAHGPRYPAGSTLLGATVQRTLAVLEDTEIAVIVRNGAASVLKIDRTSRDAGPGASAAVMTARLQHEAAYLSALGGVIAPRLLATGTHDGRAYIEMELIDGVDAATAMSEHRAVEAERGPILHLARRIAHAYADLHAQGVLHGDVHPRNILVEASGAVRLVDFGVASAMSPRATLPLAAARGGIPFFFEPELARASLANRPVPASPTGEQYGLAAVLWLLVTGNYCQQFRLGRDAMLEDIAQGPVRTFTECGAAAWPALDAVLRRALAKEPGDRFTSMEAFAAALDAIETPSERAAQPRWRAGRGPLEDTLALASPDGPWWNGTLTPGPIASITYGAAGLAVGLLHVAQRHDNPHALALSDVWARRAFRDSRREDSFHNATIQITPDVVGTASPYHAISGVHAAAALVAAAQADPMSQADAIAEFVASTSAGANGLDLTVGQGSIALGAALILDALGPNPYVETRALRTRGAEAIASIWRELDAMPDIPDAGIEYLGIAHGWAGFLYTTLLWSEISGSPPPSGLERRLDELARLAMPTGRGAEWPWLLQRGSQMTMPGWCNGTCGYVFLWNLAHRQTGHIEHAALAERAAWHAWEAAEPGTSLCCGLGGRAYGLLNHYRHTGDGVWLQRAEQLAHRAATDNDRSKEFPHSLYKGMFGVAVLLADLDRPDESAMPFFEAAPRRSRPLRSTT